MIAAKVKEIEDIQKEKQEWEEMITEEVGEMEAKIAELTAANASAVERAASAEGALALLKEEKAEVDEYLAEFEAMSIEETERLTADSAKLKAESESLTANADKLKAEKLALSDKLEIMEMTFEEEKGELQSQVETMTASIAKLEKDLEKTKKMKRNAAKAAAEAQDKMNEMIAGVNADDEAVRLHEELDRAKMKLMDIDEVLGDDGLEEYKTLVEAVENAGLEMADLPEMMPQLMDAGQAARQHAQQLQQARNKADLYKQQAEDLDAEIRKLRLAGVDGAAAESSSGEEESDDEEDLPFDDKHLLELKFAQPGSLGLAYAPSEGKRVIVARVMPGSQAAKLKKKPKAGYFVCKIGNKRVYEVGYDTIMEALKAAPRPITITFGIPG